MSKSDIHTLESELATALASLKPFLLKRSWLSIPKNGSEIGVGGFGTVHRGVLQKGFLAPKMSIAVKKLFASGDRSKRLRVALELVRELTVQSSLNHPNILPLVGFHLNTTLEEAWIVSPYIENGNVYEYLELNNPSLDERLELVKDTARGLDYLHTRQPPICHGDIKALNVLVGSDKNAMLCDFGLSKTNEGRSSVITSNNGGTSRYWSPELFTPEGRPTKESDVWAWGCLFLEIITGLAPYNDTPLDGRVIHQISEHVLPAQLDRLDCPAHVKDILARCWQIPPAARPSMTLILGLLSVGNIRYFQRASSEPSSAERTAVFDALGRELLEILVVLEGYRIKPSRLVFSRERSAIGVGGYGTVHKAIMRQRFWGNFGVLVAVKKLRAAGSRDKCARMAIALIRELAVWASVAHPNVIPLIGFHLSERLDEAWLISPYMANGNIRDYLQAGATSDRRLSLVVDTANGLAYLHGLDPPICHGDIKSLNVLITNEGRGVLCDFGLAKAMESMPSGLTTSTFDQGGSLPYESPELLIGSAPRTPRSDVWAWGCLAQEIFTGNMPYHWAMNAGVIVKWIVQDIPPAPFDELDCPDQVSGCSPPDGQRLLTAFVGHSEASSGGPSDNATAVLETLRSRATVLDRSKLVFDADSQIGSGRFGTLFRAELLDNATPPNATVVAVRRLLPTTDDQHARRRHSEMVDRAGKWAGLNNSSIVKFTGYYPRRPDVESEFLLVFSYVSGGHLADYLERERESLDYARRVKLATEVVEGLLYLHTRSPPIRHGNLHPRNILIGDDGHALLCDYDLDGLASGTTGTSLQPIETLRYKSPEELGTNLTVMSRSDIWSFASVFLTIITNQVPYGNVEMDGRKLAEAMSQRILPAEIDNLDCPIRAQNLLGVCWKWELEFRPTASEVVSILSGRTCRLTKAWSIPANKPACLRFSHSGEYLAVGYEGLIKVFKAESGNLVAELPLPKAKPFFLQISHSGRYLAASTWGNKIMLWDLATRKLKGEYKGHKNEIWGLDLAFDDSYIVSGAYDMTVRVWPMDGQDTPSQVVHTNLRAECLITHSSSYIMAVSLRSGDIQIRSIHEDQVLATLSCRDTAWALRFSPDGNLLYAGCVGGSARSWDIGDLLQQPSAASKTDGPSKRAANDIKRGGATVTAVNANSKWCLAIDGETNVWALDLQPNGMAPQTIAKIDGTRDPSRTDLSAVSEDGSGFVVSGSMNAKIMAVWKYVFWDTPGVYHH